MADLFARFQLIDDMSAKMENIANTGQNMVSSWQSAGDSMTNSLNGIGNATSGVVSSVDGVAQSVSSLGNASSGAQNSADQLAAAMDGYGNAAESASSATDDWTDAVGNYDKSALEAIYSTEELVEMGFKTEQALQKEQNAMTNCQKSAEALSKQVEKSSKVQDNLSDSIEDAQKVLDEMTETEGISAKSKEKLTQASDKAKQAMENLSLAQDEAAAAMAEYESVMASGTKDLDALQSAEQKAQTAAERLAEANDNAADAMDELDNETEQAQGELDKFGDKGSKAVKAVADALAAAGIVKLVGEVKDAFMAAAAEAEVFETSIAQLQTIAGAEHINELSADINKLSAETGISADSLAEVAYNAISAGASVENAVTVAESAAKLATAGFTDTTSALSVLSTAMNSYGDAAGTAEDISNSLIMVQNLGVTTVAELSQQMGKAIATASSYNVSLGNLESAYVSTTKSGIATAESTTYISGMLNELGKSSSTVSKILQEETGQSFGQLMQSGYSLADVLDILYQNVNGNAEAMMNLWGSAEAGKAAAAIVNQGLDQFNENLNAIENSAGATEKAYSVMADTTQYAHNKMTNSMKQVSTAFGSTLNPALEKIYNAVAKLMGGVANFIEKHPKVVKAASAIAIGLGVVAVGVVGVTTVVNVLIPAIASLGVAINTAMGPIGWIALGITAVTAAVSAFVLMADDAEDATEGLTATSKAQYYELQNLNAEYENACEVYGETSTEASLLRSKINDLSAAFGDGGKTVEQFVSECDAAVQKHAELIEESEKASESIKNEELDNLALIAKLEQLASTSGTTAESQQAMKAIIDQLNNSVDGLNLTYTDLITNQGSTIENIRAMAKAQAEQQRAQQKYEEYVKLLGEAAEMESQIAEKQDEVTVATKASSDAEQEYLDYLVMLTKYDTTGTSAIAAMFSSQKAAADEARETMETEQAALDELNAAYEDANNRIREIEESWGLTEDAITSGSENIVSEAEAISIAYEGISENLTELCEKYDEAYEAAKTSLEGQFGLFDEASMKSEEYLNATVANAQKALESQLAYWESYNADIDVLRQKSADDLGMTQENYDALMSYVQSGSEEAAGLANSMVQAIESGNEEAVTKLGETFTAVQTQKEQASKTIADWQTDFSNQMDGILQKMEETVSSLNMEDGAAESATATMKGYIDNIKAHEGSAVAAAQGIANAVKNALSTTATVKVNVVQNTVPGHATGTTNAEDVFIAGEEGPELIVGKAGSTVFPNEATERIIQSVTENQNIVQYGGAENEGNGMVIINALYAVLSGFTSSVDKFTDEVERTQQAAIQASVLDIPGYATGTNDSESNFIAGEKGPELVIGHPNATVFPADDTERIIGSMEEKPLSVEGEARSATDTNVAHTGKTSGKAAEETKRIFLEIAGTGGIEIGSKTNKTDVLEIIQQHLKPVLMSVIQQEIFEEGELSYEF